MNNKLKKKVDKRIFDTIAYIIVIGFSLFCLLPFIMMLSGSLSTESIITSKGYALWPRGLTTFAYRILFRDASLMLNAFKVSAIVMVCGTTLSILLCSMTAYALGRKNFKHRNKLAFFYYFTTLFNGGLVPYYIIMVNYYHAKNSLLALILPATVNVWNMLVLRSFMKNDVPDALPESAKIDGAGEFRIYWSIVLPLMKPSLMAIGFFTAIGYWNDWYSAMLFIDENNIIPLQYQLYKMLNTINFMVMNASKMSSSSGVQQAIEIPNETVKLAMAVIAAAPIIFLYSFIQKYFVKGITIGAVKG